MKSKSYVPTYNAKLKLTKRVVNTPDKVIRTRKSINNKLANIKQFVDSDKNLYNIRRDKKKVQALLVNNLKKNRKINIKNIQPPKQCGNNCWFNVLFLCYFISDQGRKFTKPLRLSMITGDYDKDLVNKANYTKLTDALFMFNLGIEGALNGSSFASDINTNEIITNIYKSINIPEDWTYHKGYGNPLVYYEGLINFLYARTGSPLAFYYLTPYIRYSIADQYTVNMNKFPHIIVIELMDDQSTVVTTRKTHLTLTSPDTKKKANYRLDSVCIRDVNQTHVGCLITLNKSGYLFDADGPLQKRMKPMNWNNETFLNNDKHFSLGNNYSRFNLRKGYQILYYYRY
tara:strand:- start:4845 stop:5876 length:1032 start_codon:yes stop_codon:yes gene_type:complete